MADFGYIFTDIGLAKNAAWLAGGPEINITHIAYGDANGSYYTLSSTQTALVHEVKRVNVNDRGIYSSSPAKVFYLGEHVPPSDYGYAIREVGLFDSNGDLIAISLYPLIDKTYQGNNIELYPKEVIVVANTAAFTLTVDPNVIMATQEYVQNEMSDHNADPDAHYDVTQQHRGFMSPLDKIKLDNLSSNLQFANNRGKLVNGKAGFLSRVNNSKVSISANSGDEKLIMTSSQGSKNIIQTSMDINLNTDGLWKLLWDYDNNQELLTTNQVHISQNLPSDGDWVNGDFWLTYFGKNDYLGFRKVAGSRVDFEFSVLGEMLRADNIILDADVRSYAYNGHYNSGIIDIISDMPYDKSANIGTELVEIMLYLRKDSTTPWAIATGYSNNSSSSIAFVGTTYGIKNANIVGFRTEMHGFIKGYTSHGVQYGYEEETDVTVGQAILDVERKY